MAFGPWSNIIDHATKNWIFTFCQNLERIFHQILWSLLQQIFYFLFSLGKNFFSGNLSMLHSKGSGYFVVKTELLLPFSAKKLPHGCKAKEKLCPTSFWLTGTKWPKGCRRGNIMFLPFWHPFELSVPFSRSVVWRSFFWPFGTSSRQRRWAQFLPQNRHSPL